MTGFSGRVVRAVALVAAVAAVAAWALRPQADRDTGSLLVFTEVNEPESGVDPDWRFPAGSRIVAVDLTDPEAPPRLLTPEFEAARATDIHFDGRTLLFAGQKDTGGPWQVWELDLRSGATRLVVPSCERCTDPIYRADDGVVFVAPAGQDGEPMAAYTVGPEGGDPTRITFHPVSDAAPGLASDGRVVVATEATAERPPTAYYALRHDGTGAELLYRSEGSLPGRAWRREDRDLVFVEHPAGGAGRVVSISEAYPGTSRQELLTPSRGRVHSASPGPDGSLVVSYRRDGGLFGLWTTKPGSGDMERLREPDGRHAIDPILATPHPRPLGFVSATDPASATGVFFGIDARRTGRASVDSGAVVLRVRAPTGPLGDVPLAEDGSFHIELPANTPMQLETLDGEGRVVRGPSAWIWIRPGELRGCVGCHEDRGLTPANRLPMAAALPAVCLIRDAGTAGEAGNDDSGQQEAGQ